MRLGLDEAQKHVKLGLLGNIVRTSVGEVSDKVDQVFCAQLIT